jgi:hypothetical protein
VTWLRLMDPSPLRGRLPGARSGGGPDGARRGRGAALAAWASSSSPSGATPVTAHRQ